MNIPGHINNTYKRLIATLLICTLLITGYANVMVNLAQTRVEEAEVLIDIYEEELDECREQLDSEIARNNELSATINNLNNRLTMLEGTLSALEKEHEKCNLPATYSSENVLTPSNVTAEELSKGLYHKLRGYAKYFVAAEEKYGVNAIFLASIAALESGWGRSALAINKNNLFGYKNTNGKGYRAFSSVEECIYHVAKYLKSSYLTVGGKYYNGTSVAAVNIRYCSQSHWTSKINTIANGIVGRI